MTNTNLRAYVEDNIKGKHGRRRNATVVGLIMNILVLGYLSWMHSQVSYVTQPDNLVAAASGLVIGNIPTMKQSAVAAIKVEAPNVATFVADAIRNEVPGMIRGQLEAMILEYTTALAGYAAEQYNTSFAEIIDLAEPEIKKAIVAKSDSERDIVVMQFLDKQVDVAVKNLNGKEPGNDPTLSKINASHSALVALNKRVKDVTGSGGNAPRKTQLEKRFLYTLWRFIQNEYPDITEAPDEEPALAQPPGKK